MKKVLFSTILIIITFYLFVNNIFAAAGFSGNGSTSTSTGTGSGSGTSSGWGLQLSPIIKFTLVDVRNNIKPLKSYIMINKSGSYDEIFNSSKNIKGSGAIYGAILESGYSSNAFDSSNFPEFPASIRFSDSIMENIVSDDSWGLTFNVNNLKTSIISSCSLGSCEITAEYEKVVIFMLKEAGIINSSVTSIGEIGPETLANLNKYRIIIEPVYSLSNTSYTEYMFATPKAIGKMAKDSGEHYGIDLSLLYNNLYADEVVGDAINKGGYITPITIDEIKTSFADVSHGAGYAIVKLSYNTCFVEETGGNIIFNDTLGGKYDNDLYGVNLEYFIDACTCDAVTHSLFKDQILDSTIKNNIYNNKCVSRKCEYDATTGEYYYYGSESQLLGSYTDFIGSCGCNHANVLALKDTFSSEYNAECPPAAILPSTTTVSSNLKSCSPDPDNKEDYIITYEKNGSISGNEYCSYNCKETVNIKNLSSKTYFDNNPLTAGFHYVLPELAKTTNTADRLTVEGTKSCKFDIKYDDWLDKYDAILNIMESNYDVWQEYDSCKTIEPTPCGCSCATPANPDCCYDRTNYECTFTGSHIESSWGEPSLLKTDTSTTTRYHSYCSGGPSSTASTYHGYYLANETTLTNHLNKFKACYNTMNNEVLKGDKEDTEYYPFESELEYNYAQTYGKSSLGTVYNYERKLKVKDINETDEKLTKYVNSYETEAGLTSAKTSSTPNKKDYYPTEFSNYATGVNTIDTIDDEGTIPKSNEQYYKREVSYKYYYRPSVNKYVDAFTGKISDNSDSSDNKTYLGYYFDLDASAIEKNINDNYYKISNLGDNNNIYNWFNERKNVIINGVSRNAALDDLNRRCSHIIVNDLVECDSSNDCKLNIIYRSVDPSKIDPNGRLKIDLDGDIGFSNWDNKKGYLVKEQIEETAKTKNTYSPYNLEYSFTLDSRTIQAIRSYNEDPDNKYDDWNTTKFKCIEGKECLSEFITKASNGTFKDEDNIDIPVFAKKIDGRNNWKYLTLNPTSSEWKIEKYDRGSMTESLFESYKNQLGGITP